MTAPELLDAMHRAGATLVVEDGKPRVRGVRLPEKLLTALRGQRTAVMAEWQRRQEQARNGYAVVPSGEVPMRGLDLDLSEADREAVVAHVLRQPRPVHAWVMGRATQYYERGVKIEDCDWHACVDVIAWQRGCSGLEAAMFVVKLPTGDEILGATEEQVRS